MELLSFYRFISSGDYSASTVGSCVGRLASGRWKQRSAFGNRCHHWQCARLLRQLAVRSVFGAFSQLEHKDAATSITFAKSILIGVPAGVEIHPHAQQSHRRFWRDHLDCFINEIRHLKNPLKLLVGCFE